MTPRRARVLAAFMALVLGAALVLALLAPGDAAAETCAKCGRPIEGRFMRVGALSYHARCFTCVVCGKPIAGEYVAGGTARAPRYFHEKCYQDAVALRCSNCRRLIDGDYYPSGGKSYCPDCYARLLAPRCVVCGLAIMDVHYTANEWNEPAHEGCRHAMRACDVCGRAIGGARGAKGVRLADGRQVCERCAATGITDPRAARPLFDAVAAEIAEWGIRVDPGPVRLDLCGRNELQRLSGRWKTAGHTEVQANYLGRDLTSERLTVHILDHLGPDRFAAVAAHELTHVYLHRPGGPRLPRAVEEGFCNYIASLVLARRNTDLARRALLAMFADTDPDYGDGYRRVRAWVAAHRLDELTAALRRGTVPAGL